MFSVKFSPLFVACLIVTPQISRAQNNLLEDKQETRSHSIQGSTAKKVNGEKITPAKDGAPTQGVPQIKATSKNESAIAIGEGNVAKNSTGAIAQGSQAGPKGRMSSPSAQGVQIQGNTSIAAENKNVSAVAVGEGGSANNKSGESGRKGQTVIAIGMGRHDQKADASGQIGRGD